MPGTSNLSEREHASYSEAEIALIDEVNAAASTLSGVAEALQYRAAAEGDDMLSMLADVVCTQAEYLRRVVKSGKPTC